MKKLRTVGIRSSLPSTSAFSIKSTKWAQTHIQRLTPETTVTKYFLIQKGEFYFGFLKTKYYTKLSTKYQVEYYTLTTFPKLDGPPPCDCGRGSSLHLQWIPMKFLKPSTHGWATQDRRFQFARVSSATPTTTPTPLPLKSRHGGPFEEAEYIFPTENITSQDSSSTR